MFSRDSRYGESVGTFILCFHVISNGVGRIDGMMARVVSAVVREGEAVIVIIVLVVLLVGVRIFEVEC